MAKTGFFDIVLIAMVAYLGYIFLSKNKTIIPGGVLPTAPTPQLIDPCSINPLQPGCIATWLFNTINVARTPPPEPSTAHPSQVPRQTSFNICPYNSNLLIGDRNCKPVEQGGVPLATLEPWNPLATFAPSLGMP